MEYKSNCPSCNVPQSRWDALEPFPGFVNQCATCGEDYKSSKASCITGFFIGALLVSFFILADKKVISWSLASIIIISSIIITVYLYPYFLVLKQTPETEKNIIKKWIQPLFKWQALIIITVILLIVANSYMQHINAESKVMYENHVKKINELNTIESLKKMAIYENESLMLQNSLFNSLLELNITLGYLILIALSSNIVFYFKVKKHITR